MIEIVGAVRALPEQDEARFAHAIQEGTMVALRIIERMNEQSKIGGHAFRNRNERTRYAITRAFSWAGRLVTEVPRLRSAAALAPVN